jgi:hypothetical protein
VLLEEDADEARRQPTHALHHVIGQREVVDAAVAEGGAPHLKRAALLLDGDVHLGARQSGVVDGHVVLR